MYESQGINCMQGLTGLPPTAFHYSRDGYPFRGHGQCVYRQSIPSGLPHRLSTSFTLSIHESVPSLRCVFTNHVSRCIKATGLIDSYAGLYIRYAHNAPLT